MCLFLCLAEKDSSMSRLWCNQLKICLLYLIKMSSATATVAAAEATTILQSSSHVFQSNHPSAVCHDVHTQSSFMHIVSTYTLLDTRIQVYTDCEHIRLIKISNTTNTERHTKQRVLIQDHSINANQKIKREKSRR